MVGERILVVYITADRKNAKKMARTLIEEKLAACCNIVPISSVYWWKGRIEEAAECLLILKTLKSREGKLIKRAYQIHTYDTPEILAINADKCHEKYAEYVKKSVSD